MRWPLERVVLDIGYKIHCIRCNIGDATDVDHCEVAFNADDGFEFFALRRHRERKVLVGALRGRLLRRHRRVRRS